MFKKAFSRRIGGNKHLIHLWTDEGYQKVEWTNFAYKECSEADADYIGLNGEPLRKTSKWGPDDSGLHFHDMKAYQKFLIEKYGTNDEPSTTHRELFFDIETEMGDALTPEYIQNAPKKVTSIAWYDKQVDEWGILILDTKNQLEHTKARNKEITPCKTESDLLAKFLEKFREIDPDIIIGYNSDYFDIPYLYYRMCNVLGEDWARHLSPIGYVRETPWFKDQYIQIAGVESLDYMRLHKKFSWKDEPSWKLDAIGEKYAGINKVEYEGNLDSLFESDINKFIQYNFVDVEILVELDKKLQYIALTKNLAHKGKVKYSEVYASSKIHDGAISAYLLSEGIIPPGRPRGESKLNYAGGYLFCPKAGLYKYMFDEDLTSLYPSIIMTSNIGRETIIGKIITDTLPKKLEDFGPYGGKPDRNNYLGLSDLKEMDPNDEIRVMDSNENVPLAAIAKLFFSITSITLPTVVF